MKIILTAFDDALEDAWNKFCGNLDCVEVYRGSILDVACDAVVSPANSYGYMDGGIDMVYSKHFGWGVQERLQTVIKTDHRGQLLVGQAQLVETENNLIPYLISAPTMRVPQTLHNSANPYLAMRAILILIAHGEYGGVPVSEMIETVAVPGLGTGVGEVHPVVCAKQVQFAIKEVVYHKAEFPDSWLSAQALHYDLVQEPRNA
ncbi:Appr-1-p processing protein [Ketobacter sp. MCCC 1A13808]|uniref:macro domain-containing protein n=1 Tax=Ketobacter sp. MCCC 1A13808 TaxID=2602738 RepID=UPI0012EB8EF3|nr:macro domain-containing protein [Ketobacter sp. MCCC 1A13808]MVF12261.1 Appr-1-p processing protein [Ketobacter sp. MCCC 1A13808]